MRIGASLTPPRWRTSFAWAAGAHVLLAALLLLAPALGFFPEREDRPEIQLVRLKGGGQNRPGWVKPTPAPPDFAEVPDNRPEQTRRQETPPPAEPEAKPEPKAPAEKTAAPETKPSAAKQETPREQAPQEKAPAPAEEKEPPSQAETGEETAQAGADDTADSDQPAAEEAERQQQAAPAETGEAGEGVGAKPGPEGPGVGARSDADFPGADAWLSRVEAEVQRRFNFRGRGSGARAEYHFYLDRRGRLHDLVLMESSGIPSLDLAARSAIMRAKFPPLPPGFRHDRLGVTYYFYDDK